MGIFHLIGCYRRMISWDRLMNLVGFTGWMSNGDLTNMKRNGLRGGILLRSQAYIVHSLPPEYVCWFICPSNYGHVFHEKKLAYSKLVYNPSKWL